MANENLSINNGKDNESCGMIINGVIIMRMTAAILNFVYHNK